jgi:probable rRNA maturation factor
MILEENNLTVTSNGALPSVPFLALKEKILGKSYDLSISFVSPAKARKINIEHRNKDYVPNTLSFSLSKKSGEIVMCMSEARKQYKNFGMTFENYLIFLVLHSMLHLKGYVHGSTMENKEKHFFKLFKKPTHEKTNNRRN